jgi:hypothetical protein
MIDLRGEVVLERFILNCKGLQILRRISTKLKEKISWLMGHVQRSLSL